MFRYAQHRGNTRQFHILRQIHQKLKLGNIRPVKPLTASDIHCQNTIWTGHIDELKVIAVPS
jgi:hypothetical protein